MPTDNRPQTTCSSAKTEVIDVDAFHSRYDDSEGLVELSCAKEFRKSWRRHKERPVSIDRSQGAIAESLGHQQQVPRDFLSVLEPVIQKAMSLKRAQPSESVDPPNPSKRQRTNAGPSRFSPFGKGSLPGNEGPGARNSSTHLQTPPSPDLVFVDERRREQQPFMAVSSIVGMSSKHRTASPSCWKQDDNKPVSKMAATSASLAPRQPEQKRMEVIELFSDNENKRPRKRSTKKYRQTAQRNDSPIDLSSESDHSDDDDDDWDPPGFGLNDPDLWLPIPNNANKEDGVLHSMEHLTICSPPQLPRYQRQDTSRWSPPPPPPRQPLYIWDKLRLSESRWRPRPRPVLMQPKRLITRPKDIDFNLHRLDAVTSFKQAPGTINAIEQFGRLTVIGSACDGGLADTPDEIPSPYNRPGSLSVRSEDRLVILDEHMRRNSPKHYTINDVKFDPTCNQNFTSIGEDKRCRVWALDESLEPKWTVTMTFLYHFVPHALAFRPGSSILAVAEKRVLVYDLSHETVRRPHPFPLHDRGSPHMVGSIAWGCESTSDHLFASSEPTMRTFTGAHKTFDLRTQKTIYQFDAAEAGDVIAVDPIGGTLALCTQAEANRHILRLYDIRRRDMRAFASLDLLPFWSRDNVNSEGEMNVATFSPDQLYLALARNDNCIHVYDRRMLGKWSSEPIFKYYHHGESKTVSKHEEYGVVQAQWLQSSWTTRTCLVTGGEDGCIRMWDPSIAAHDIENGKILAEVDYDISQFSIGDPIIGEHRLIVGDSSGGVTIFDSLCI